MCPLGAVFRGFCDCTLRLPKPSMRFCRRCLHPRQQPHQSKHQRHRRTPHQPSDAAGTAAPASGHVTEDIGEQGGDVLHGVRCCPSLGISSTWLRQDAEIPFSPARGEIGSPPRSPRFALGAALALLIHRILVGAGAGAGADDGAGVVGRP